MALVLLIIIVGFSLLIFIHEFGHFLVAKCFGVRVHEFGFGFPPRLFAKRFGETLYSLNALPFGGFVRMEEREGSEEVPSERSFVRKPHWQRAAVIAAGVLMNVLFGWVLFFGIFLAGVPQHLAVLGVAPQSPAAEAGILPGDVILRAASGEAVLEDPLPLNIFIALVGEVGDREMTLSLKRGGDLLAFTLRGRTHHPSGEGSLGVSLAEIGTPPRGAWDAVRGASQTVVTMIVLITQSILSFFGNLFPHFEVLKAVVGPVGAVTFAAQTASLGIAYLFQFIAFISLNVALFNLLPFPVLDGGRLVLLLFEKIKGRPISHRIQAALNTAGFVFLVGLVILVTVHDVQRIVSLLVPYVV